MLTYWELVNDMGKIAYELCYNSSDLGVLKRIQNSFKSFSSKKLFKWKSC